MHFVSLLGAEGKSGLIIELQEVCGVLEVAGCDLTHRVDHLLDLDFIVAAERR